MIWTSPPARRRRLCTRFIRDAASIATTQRPGMSIGKSRAEEESMLSRSSVITSNEITGTKVRNLEGENIGHIEELVLDVDTGVIRYAVLSFGGFLGIGDKLFAVPWKSL